MNAPVAAAPERETEARTQCLTFQLGNELFAVGILNVREIIEYGHLTVVPMMPDSVRGVINLRGAVVPVIDLRRRFGHGLTEIGRRTCIVIVETPAAEETQVVGIMVDAVNEVLDIPDTQIEPPPAFGTHLRTDFIRGMAKMDKGFILVLDLNHVLAEDNLHALLQEGESTAA
jgi:purine-binding chemotaxis protein CheW